VCSNTSPTSYGATSGFVIRPFGFLIVANDERPKEKQVMPMKLKVDDRLTDESGVWEVSGPPLNLTTQPVVEFSEAAVERHPIETGVLHKSLLYLSFLISTSTTGEKMTPELLFGMVLLLLMMLVALRR